MGFLHINKVMSIEDVYSQYKAASEQEGGKEIKIFDGFKFEKGMTLQEFEDQNLEVYKRYESMNTELLSPEYTNASSAEKVIKFAEIYKKYYPEDADKIDEAVKDIANKRKIDGQYRFANFIEDMKNKKLTFGLESLPKEGETYGSYEDRIKQDAVNKGIDKIVAEVADKYHLDSSEHDEYDGIEFDPTMRRDPETHDW